MDRSAAASFDHLSPDFEVLKAMLGAGEGPMVEAGQVKGLN
jgi:hypothetical protein